MIRCGKNKISKKTVNSNNDFEILCVVYRSYEWLIDLSKDLLSDVASFKKKFNPNKWKL